MDRLPFTEYHLLAFFKFYMDQNAPIDAAMSSYFRKNKALGSKDKKFVSENAYTLMRWKGLIDHFIEGKVSWDKRWELHQKRSISSLLKEELPLHIRCSAPLFLVDRLKELWGERKTLKFFHTSNRRAPLCVRANHLVTTRDELLTRWKAEFPCAATTQSPYGIVLKEHVQLFGLDIFKEGHFEVQDEGSQVVADLVTPKKGDHILDYCAGSGGKALAFAPKTQGHGQIYLYDIRKKALLEAKKRMKRARVQNYQIVSEESIASRSWKQKMNWIFVDAPCSGTGTLRRNPDLKWKIDQQMIKELVGKQKYIFEKALALLRPGGHIIYCTCSVLPEENEKQIEYFLANHSLEKVNEFSSFPMTDEMDGFFAAVLKKP